MINRDPYNAALAQLKQQLAAVTTELAAYLSGPEYSLWPLDPSQPLPPAPPDEPADAQPLESASSPSTEVTESVQTDPEPLNAPVA